MSFMALLPPLISAGGSLLGGIMGQNQQDKNNARQMAFSYDEASRDERWRQVQQENYKEGMGFTREQWEAAKAARTEDLALQKEFAKSGVQWRAEDARAAGIHPLAGLGMQGASSTPIQIGHMSTPSGGTGGSSISAPNLSSDNHLGKAMASMGQNISEGIQNAMNAFDRQNAAAQQLLQTKNMALQNKLLEGQIAAQTARVFGKPSFPSSGGNMIAGQGNSPARGLVSTALVKEEPHKPVVGIGPGRSQEPEGITDVGYGRTGTGLAPVPSKDIKDRIEDQILPELAWGYRQMVLPNLGLGIPPAHSPAHKYWNPVRQEWQTEPNILHYRYKGSDRPAWWRGTRSGGYIGGGSGSSRYREFGTGGRF